MGKARNTTKWNLKKHVVRYTYKNVSKITKETDKSPIHFKPSSKIHIPGSQKIFFHLKPYKTNPIIIMQFNSESGRETANKCLESENTHL